MEVTNEWYLLQDGETIPAGAHVKVDMSTGEKWVKQVSSSEGDREEEKINIVEISSDGSSKKRKFPSSSLMEIPEENVRSEDDEIMMMYRVLSKLPPSEIGDDGTVLPILPITQEGKKSFELQVRAIWERRQQLLVNLSQSAGDDDSTSSIADGMSQLQLPKLLNRYIVKMRSFLNQRYAACYGEEFATNVTNFSDVLFILNELEYHLSDIDAARDFHTLGGWPILGFLLSSPPWLWDTSCAIHQQMHLHNTTLEDESILSRDEELKNYRQQRDTLQTAVSWVVGNAVKNHAEFAMWSLEPIPTTPLQLFGNSTPSHTSSKQQLLIENDSSVGSGNAINIISLLLDIIQQKSALEEDLSSNLLAKSMYAISAILRGNPYAQLYFHKMGGGLILGNMLDAALFSNNQKLVKRILSLAHDILVEISTQQQQQQQQQEHYGVGPYQSSSILDEQEQLAVLRGFTGKQWCQSAFQMFELQYSKQNHHSEVEAVLRIIEPMIPHCQDSFEMERTKEIMQRLKVRWSSSEVDDLEWRQELLELADSVQNKLQ